MGIKTSKLPLTMGDQHPLPSGTSLDPPDPTTPNGIQIQLAVFPQITPTNTQTDRHTDSVEINVYVQ